MTYTRPFPPAIPPPPEVDWPEHLLAAGFPEPLPVMDASALVYVITSDVRGQGIVYLYGPTLVKQRVHITSETQTAQDQAEIIIQLVTQDYFQRNLKYYVPHVYWEWDHKKLEDGGGDGALHALTQVFAITLDEIKQSIDDFTKLFDIDHCPTRYLKIIATLLGYPLEDADSTAEQRWQLRTAVEWYRSKGSRKAFQAILYAFGFDAEIIPLWTRKWVDDEGVSHNYEEFVEDLPAEELEGDPTVYYGTVPGVAAGNDPPNDYPLLLENGGEWYRSPHFGVRLNALVGDEYITLIWDGVDPALKVEFELLAAEIGYHAAYLEMKDELLEAGVEVQYYFAASGTSYLSRRIEFLRPVFAVLEWIEFVLTMHDNVDVTEAHQVVTAMPILPDKGWYLGYCDMDDKTYTRLDPRLLGDNYLTITSPLIAPGTPPDVTGEVAFTFGAPAGSTASGTLDSSPVYPYIPSTPTDPDDAGYSPGVELTIQISGVGAVVLRDNGEGVFIDDPDDTRIIGTINYMNGFWELEFTDVTYVPVNSSNILADYLVIDGIPPVDRSGILPRGATELPYPLVRWPEEGICHPPEDLDVHVIPILDEEYRLPLTRDGLNLYPSSGGVPFIDRADFPSRGFVSSSGAGHANILTREFGYATRPLSFLRIDAQSVDVDTDYHGEDTDYHGEDAGYHGGGPVEASVTQPVTLKKEYHGEDTKHHGEDTES